MYYNGSINLSISIALSAYFSGFKSSSLLYYTRIYSYKFSSTGSNMISSLKLI